MDLFEGQVEELLVALREALASGDRTALEKAAHSLKGSVGHWGKGVAWEAAKELEEAARRSDLAAAAAGAANLDRELPRLRTALTEFAKEA